jgi:hypothetical protein
MNSEYGASTDNLMAHVDNVIPDQNLTRERSFSLQEQVQAIFGSSSTHGGGYETLADTPTKPPTNPFSFQDDQLAEKVNVSQEVQVQTKNFLM